MKIKIDWMPRKGFFRIMLGRERFVIDKYDDIVSLQAELEQAIEEYRNSKDLKENWK